MEISQLLDQMQADGTLFRVANNPLVQFGTDTRAYLGATILPERTVRTNAYRESKIGFRTLVANHGSRYSPAQRKNGKFIGHFDVVLSDSDIADEFTGEEYDTLLDLITPIVGPIDGQSVPGMAAIAQVARWIDKGINLPLVEVNEVMRWQALVDKKVTLRGDNGYKEDINYPSYPDLTINASNWADPNVDPMDDFQKIATAFGARGVTLARVIMGLPAITLLMNNAKIRARIGPVVIANGGNLVQENGLVDASQLNALFTRNNLPVPEQYNLQYRTQVGSNFFLRRDAVVVIGTSDSEERIDLGEGQFEIVPGTLGYLAVGRGVGRPAPGRYIRSEAFDNKPPRITAEGWQTSLPVITEPDLVAVLKGLNVPKP